VDDHDIHNTKHGFVFSTKEMVLTDERFDR